MSTSGYAPVNGFNMYYEVHGSGTNEPLVLLHGAQEIPVLPPFYLRHLWSRAN